MPYTPPSSTAVVLQFAVGGYTPPSSTAVVLQFASDGSVQTAGQTEAATAGSDLSASTLLDGGEHATGTAAETAGAASGVFDSSVEPATSDITQAGLVLLTADGSAPGTGTTAHTVQADFVGSSAAVAVASEAPSGSGTQTFSHTETGAAAGAQSGTGVMASGATSPASAAAAQTTVTTLSMSESEPTPALAEHVAQRTANETSIEPLTATADAGTTGEASDYVVEEGAAQDTGLAGNGLPVEITEAGYVLDFLSAFILEFYQRAKRVTHVLRGSPVTYVARKDPERKTNIL